MTSIEEHKRKIKEHLGEINDAIDQGMENKPITIGFHCSACVLELLELYLHVNNKLPIEKIIKHDWFKRPKQEQKKSPLVERHLPVQFKEKEELYELIYDIEDERNSLLYGKPQEKQIKTVLKKFQEFKEKIMELLKNENLES